MIFGHFVGGGGGLGLGLGGRYQHIHEVHTTLSC